MENSVKSHFLNSIMAFGALGFALVSQYGFGLFPCHLCILQRIPYVVAGLLGLLGIWAWKQGKHKLANGTLAISILAYLTTMAIAIYHAAVEMHLVSGPSGCSSQGAAGLSDEELLAQIMNAPIVMCDDISVEFLGLSMAGWNAAYALMCVIIFGKLYVKGRKNG